MAHAGADDRKGDGGISRDGSPGVTCAIRGERGLGADHLAEASQHSVMAAQRERILPESFFRIAGLKDGQQIRLAAGLAIPVEDCLHSGLDADADGLAGLAPDVLDEPGLMVSLLLIALLIPPFLAVANHRRLQLKI